MRVFRLSGHHVPWEGPPPRSSAKFLPHCFDVWTFGVGLNVTTTKKSRELFGGRKVHPREKSARPEKILATRMRKKGPRHTLVCPSSSSPEWLIRPCIQVLLFESQLLYVLRFLMVYKIVFVVTNCNILNSFFCKNLRPVLLKYAKFFLFMIALYVCATLLSSELE